MGMAELVEAGGGLRGSFQGAVARDYGISRRGVITLVQRCLADGTDVEILNIVDDHSRLCIASVCRPDQRRSPQQSTSTRPLRVRHDTMDASGKLTLRHGSRLHHIGTGRCHRHQPVLVLGKDLHVRNTTTSGELLRDSRTRSQPGLPTPTQNGNDVPRHLCTVSRDNAVG
jgi:hypothetical protein